MEHKIKLAIVEDLSLMRKGIISLLNEFDSIEVVTEASDGKDFIEKLDADCLPNIVLLDYEMPVMNGVETLEFLKNNYPEIKVIILTMYNEEWRIIDTIERGVNGFLKKDEDIEKIVFSIQNVFQNNYYFNERVSTIMAKKLLDTKKKGATQNQECLSEKENEVIKLICKEYNNKEIAEKLFLSPRTIDGYREKIMQKIGAKNTAGVVIYALKHHLID